VCVCVCVCVSVCVCVCDVIKNARVKLNVRLR